jgi:hypothetical protein
MDVEIEFISSEALKGRSTNEKIRYILDRVKQEKIIVVEESLTSLEETKLIEETMKSINKKFPGIEVSTLRDRKTEGFRDFVIRALGGTSGGLTVIGPSKLIKKVKKEPTQINLLAGEKD